jgi:diguanylate cyclase (GGDEF)-like protein/PAS domain S-box-containing protein
MYIARVNAEKNILRNGVPLHESLFVRMGTLVAGAVALVGIVFFEFGMEPLARRAAESQLAEAAARVTADLDGVFLPTEHILGMSRQWIAGAPPPPGAADAFNAVFMPVLEALPEASSINVGTSAGEGWMLMQHADGGWGNRLTDVGRWGRRHVFVERAPDGAVRRRHEDVDYDPRLRAWYAAAAARPGRVQWTPPYAFFTTGDPGITASVSVPSADGRLLVIGIDLMLRDLSLKTMRARPGRHGLAAVLTADRRVLALPAPPPEVSREDWLGKLMRPAGELGLAPLAAAQQALATPPATAIAAFTADGTAWLSSAHPYLLGDQPLWVVTLAPAADFAPDWPAILTPLAAASAALLLLVAGFARRQARRIAHPLETLTAASDRIGLLDFARTAVPGAGIAEIDRLAAAQERMRRLLLRHQQKISSQQARLRSQIRALSAARQKVRESEAYNKVFYADSRIPLLILDPETGRCIDCNPAAARVNGLPDRDAVIGKSPAELSPPRQYDGTPSDIAAAEAIKAALERGATIRAWRHRRPDGTEWDGEIHLMPFHDGRRLLVQCSIQDVTQRTESLRALQRLALYDTLTGLINRAPFIERLSETLAAAREAGKSAAILYLDLDRFKEINDAQGHTVGDEVLREVARRFAGALDAEHVLARLGGDEFAILAADADAAGAALIAERIIGTLAWRIEVGQHAFTLGVSAGIALFPGDGEDPDTLLRHADIAMYRAKSSRRGHMRYAPEMSSGLAESITLARDLQEALRERPGELSLHYQPQFDLRGGRLLGAEALMRWTHPTLGPVPPAVFIPVAESRGMMAAIGRWVFAEGCRQIQAWRRDGRPFTGRLAINIATQQIEDARFPERINEIICAAGLEPRLFELELTESGMMKNVEQSIDLFTRLNAFGFSLSIDDFGTGYSSLSYLKRLPARKMKIDKSFVRDMVDDVNDHTIVATIIAMGRTLGMRTIAEGVETQAQADALLALGCDEVQGYYFGYPEPAASFAEKWLRAPAAETRR